MLLHHETYRLLASERINRYLREAAIVRLTRIAGTAGERRDPDAGSTSAARALRAALRILQAAIATIPALHR